MTPAERTFSIPLADSEEAIEELSRAMAEGFSAVMEDLIENFDKPDGLSAVGDEYFKKFDEPVRKHESDKYECGTRASEKVESNMTRSQELAVLTIQREWRWMHKKIQLRAANEERLRVKMHDVRYDLVQRLPKGVSAKKMEGLKEIQSTLKDVEKELRMLFNEKLATLEIEFRCSSRDFSVHGAGAGALRLRMASLFLCWLRQDVIFRAGGRTRHQVKKCVAQRIFEYMLGHRMEKRDFESASSVTWFGVADPFTKRRDVEFLFVSMEW